ncbi:MAG: hypothetical protein WAM14_21945 [Candidatus Nitrosopolaris sp.]
MYSRSGIPKPEVEFSNPISRRWIRAKRLLFIATAAIITLSLQQALVSPTQQWLQAKEWSMRISSPRTSKF